MKRLPEMKGGFLTVLMGALLGFLATFATACEEEDTDCGVEGCFCTDGITSGTTTLGETSAPEEGFPSLDGAWLDLKETFSNDGSYDPNNPSAILEYREEGQLIRVKFGPADDVAWNKAWDAAHGGAGGQINDGL